MRPLLLLALLLTASAGEPATPGFLLERAIALNRVQEPELDPAALRGAFTTLCESLRQPLAQAATPRERIAVLNRVLLADRQVSYLSNLYWRDATLAAAVLRGKANCLGTSTLYVLVGEALDLPLRMVVVPQHAFVRWDDGKERINIETTAKGIERSDADYLKEVEVAEAAALRWGQSLDRDGFLAQLTEVVAGHRFGAGELNEARALLAEVERLAPWRLDLRLAHIATEADQTKDRKTARERMAAVLAADPPDAIACRALCWLAEDASAQRQVQRQRSLLLQAFVKAPRSQRQGVLHALAFCHRTLRDRRGALRYYELALALSHPGSPQQANELYCLAILLKEDGRIDDALRAVDGALSLNPESWNLQVIKAGYLCHAKRIDEGKALFATVAKPRAQEDFWNSMQAWFYAVSGQDEAFYRAFTITLEATHSEHTLTWIDQDEDLDRFRKEARFRELVATHRARLLGEAAPAGR